MVHLCEPMIKSLSMNTYGVSTHSAAITPQSIDNKYLVTRNSGCDGIAFIEYRISVHKTSAFHAKYWIQSLKVLQKLLGTGAIHVSAEQKKDEYATSPVHSF